MEAASFYLPLCGCAGLGQVKDTAESPDLVAKIVDVLLLGLVQQGHAQIVDYLTMIPSSKSIGTSSVGSWVLKFFGNRNFLS